MFWWVSFISVFRLKRGPKICEISHFSVQSILSQDLHLEILQIFWVLSGAGGIKNNSEGLAVLRQFENYAKFCLSDMLSTDEFLNY